MSDDEIHDTSRVDAFMTARRRAMVLHAVWRPMLAGAAGAALVIAAVWVTLPKISYREIEVPKVTMRDVTVPNIVARDVTVDHVVPKDVEIYIPRIVTTPTPTRAEHEFISRPEFLTAQFKGRLVADPEGRIRFDSGDVFVPVKYDVASGRLTQDFDAMYVTEPYWGDWAFCNSIPASDHQFKCLAIDHDVVVDLAATHRLKGARS